MYDDIRQYPTIPNDTRRYLTISNDIQQYPTMKEAPVKGTVRGWERSHMPPQLGGIWLLGGQTGARIWRRAGRLRCKPTGCVRWQLIGPSDVKLIASLFVSPFHSRSLLFYPHHNSFLFHARLEPGWIANGTRMERGWNADGNYADETRMERGTRIGTRMERGLDQDLPMKVPWVII